VYTVRLHKLFLNVQCLYIHYYVFKRQTKSIVPALNNHFALSISGSAPMNTIIFMYICIHDCVSELRKKPSQKR